jgi:protein-tyrosine phosphatase
MKYILDGLAIGSFEEALIPSRQVSALLNVAEEKDLHETNLIYHKIPIVDMSPIPSNQLQEAVEWIREHITENNIMVFCNLGVGRSPSVVIGYFCSILGYGFGEAVEMVARKKPDISILPNLITTIDEVKANISLVT